jgi:putative transport protein
MADLGLIVFIAVVGLNAGPHAMHAVQTKGVYFFLSIFGSGMVVTLAGPVVGTLIGRYLLKLDPVLIVGGVSGAQTCTPAVSALRESSGSNVVALGYTIPYAIGNIVLTVWGPVIVAVMYHLGRH